MARPEKVAVVEEVRGELADNMATLLTEYRGLSVQELAELRRELRQAGARYVVVKNTLARRAAAEAGYDELEALFVGPTALTICKDDPVGPAKALRKFAKDHPQLVIKGGILEGRVVDATTAEGLADLESREELLGKLAGMMYVMLSGAASVFQAPIQKMARLVAALEDKGIQPAGSDEGAADESDEAADESDEAADGDESDGAAAVAESVAETAAEVVTTAAEAAAEVVSAAGEVASDAVETAGEVAASVAEAATGEDETGDDDETE